MITRRCLRRGMRVWAPLAAFGILGCHDLAGVSGSQALPAGISDPNSYNSPTGALQLYNGALCGLIACFSGSSVSSNGNIGVVGRSSGAGSFTSFMLVSGLLSDEIQPANLGGAAAAQYANVGSVLLAQIAIDSRNLPENAPYFTGAAVQQSNAGGGLLTSYYDLQLLRIKAMQAIGTLQKYAPALNPALQGHMYAVQGYAEILLADLFCSGIPLSTVDYQADYTYRPGSSTRDVYEHAAALMDTALSLSSDSARILNLARVGLGRALLSQGQYAQAALAVANVPDDFSYQFPISMAINTGDLFTGQLTVANAEAGIGLTYVTANDPRVVVKLNRLAPNVTTTGANSFGVLQYFPAKYTTGGSAPLTTAISATATTTIVLASGVEARLIQAEAALHAGDISGWLTMLNTLRTTSTTCTVLTVPSCNASASAGTGGVAGLPRLIDPATQPLPAGKSATDVQVDLMFKERAYWLFLTGHRQSDMRGLIREYERPVDQVYPVGAYPAGALPAYGPDVTIPVPLDERVNPKFNGCLSRGA